MGKIQGYVLLSTPIRFMWHFPMESVSIVSGGRCSIKSDEIYTIFNHIVAVMAERNLIRFRGRFEVDFVYSFHRRVGVFDTLKSSQKQELQQQTFRLQISKLP
jgi:hypothetical protein